MDELNEVNSLDLNRYSVILPDKEVLRPTNWHVRTGHCLKLQNPAQCSLNNIFKIALNFFMVVNSKKRQTMILNTSRNIDVEPISMTPNSGPLQFVTKAKFLGFILNEKLKIWDNTLTIESKSYKRIWVLKRLKNLGCDLNELTTAYIRLVWSVCEFSVTYWGTMICGKESTRNERIQKTALHVILENDFGSYNATL